MQDNPPDSPKQEAETKEDLQSHTRDIYSEISEDASSNVVERPASAKFVPAAPSVRKLARELGADITRVSGTGPANRITIEDVKHFVKQAMQTSSKGGGIAQVALPDFSKWGEINREPMSQVRKLTAESMSLSWQNIPHVNHFDKADVTDLEQFRLSNLKKAEKAGAKLTITAILLKVVGEALVRFPKFNASIDMQKKEVIYKKYVHVGIAVDTDRGLLVPVIRDVNQKSIIELSKELGDIAQRARERKITPDEMQGGNFIISNLGGIGGINFTPIIYPTNVAILGVSRTQKEPVYINGELQARDLLPLSVSYDHRLIDGAEGARFSRWICDVLENPMTLLL